MGPLPWVLWVAPLVRVLLLLTRQLPCEKVHLHFAQNWILASDIFSICIQDLRHHMTDRSYRKFPGLPLREKALLDPKSYHVSLSHGDA